LQRFSKPIGRLHLQTIDKVSVKGVDADVANQLNISNYSAAVTPA